MKPLWWHSEDAENDQAWYKTLVQNGWELDPLPEPTQIQSDQPVLWRLDELNMDQAVALQNRLQAFPTMATAHEALNAHLANPVVCAYQKERLTHGLSTLKEALRARGVCFCCGRDGLHEVLNEAEIGHRKLKRLTQENAQLREKLQQRALIEQAKGRLMQTQKLNENEAYHLMRRQAMNEGQKLVVFAQNLLKSTECPSRET
ncbi:MAG: ANTAR domain-containing protein [Hydrogenovibrio sp.]|uniref:ANTAR domain-containing response regulator n=1 Tax=Hydrogenovibrio sp. TaxID=2065821 RepID=UPI00286FBD28|nr:ANTAR domain-containing protein [Hydrogenovibrio sp.]MDR9498679.1 ANTAR domain-containing protein [Hydrogenovibrio sp.]